MSSKRESSIVLIPAHNEASAISYVLDRTLPLGIPVLVVANGCSDNTAFLASKAGASVLELDESGYSLAIRAGYEWALSRNVKYVAQIDADFQHPPVYIPRLLSYLDEVDWVIGSREGTGSKGGAPRRLSSFLLHRWTKYRHNVTLRDPCSGMWGLNVKAMRVFSDLFPLNVMEANVRIEALRRGLQLREIAVPMMCRTSGASMHDGFKGVYHFTKSILELEHLRKS